MDVFDSIINNTLQDMCGLINDFKAYNNFNEYLDKVAKDIEECNKTGKWKGTYADHNDENSFKENINTTEKPQKQRRQTKQSGLKESTNITTESVQNLTNDSAPIPVIKIEQNDDIEMPPPQQLPLKRKNAKQIKEETTKSKNQVEIKKETIEPKRSTRTRKRTAQIKQETSTRSSDVMLVAQNISLITLSDSEDESTSSQKENKKNEDVSEEKEVESTEKSEEKSRTTFIVPKAREKVNNDEQLKRLRSPSTDDGKRKPKAKQSKRTKRKKSEDTPEKDNSVYEDAISNSQGEMPKKGATQTNETFILDANIAQDAINKTVTVSDQIMDKTVILNKVKNPNQAVVLEKPKVLMNETVSKHMDTVPQSQSDFNIDDLMTDDESGDEKDNCKNKNVVKAKKGTKPIFSTYENSPVKKRVEAFEKLGAEAASEIPVRLTRTKTRAQAKQTAETEQNVDVEKPKAKPKTTPLSNRRLSPSVPNTLARLNRIPNAGHHKISSNETLIPAKSVSALKASQEEYQAREKKRREKEAEALRKREAILHAQIEEKKRKREEKMLKAQQARDTIEKEKLKQLEQQEKLKDQKYKQSLQERQEKLLKQREEAEKRRLLAAKKAMEEKRREEEKKKAVEEEEKRLAHQNERAARRENQKEGANVKANLPIYMTKKPPLLPTDDCYDSDDPKCDTKSIRTPVWTRKDHMHGMLTAMQNISDKIRNTFFLCEAQTPNLEEIFENIDPKKLKRTSSAIWRKPPRFTMMPLQDSFLEQDDEDQD